MSAPTPLLARTGWPLWSNQSREKQLLAASVDLGITSCSACQGKCCFECSWIPGIATFADVLGPCDHTCTSDLCRRDYTWMPGRAQ